MYYIDKATGKRELLTEDQLDTFGDLIGSIADGDVRDVDNILDDDPILAHAFDEDGATALRFASRHHTDSGLEIVKILMRCGADPYAKTNRGSMPIHNIDRITDNPELKAQFCEAMGIDVDTATTLDRLLDERAERKARAQVEAEYAAREIAEATARNEAYERATTYEEKVAIDPDRAAEEYFNREDVQKVQNTINYINQRDVNALYETITGSEAIEAVNSLEKKPDQLVYSVDEDISSIIADMFANKESDIDADSKETVLVGLCDWLGIDLSQLAYLVNIASGSGFLPIYHGSPHRGGDDFGDHGSSGGNGVMFDAPPLEENEYVVATLGNGTIVVANHVEEHSM